MDERPHDWSQSSDEGDRHFREIKEIKGRRAIGDRNVSIDSKIKNAEHYRENSPVEENSSDENSSEVRRFRSKSVDPVKLQQTSTEKQNTSDIPNESVDESQITDDANDDENSPPQATKPDIPEPRKRFSVINLSCPNIAIAIVIFVIAVILGWPYYSEPKKVHRSTSPSCEHFSELQKKYPTMDYMLWPTLIVGVDRAINRSPGEPATFIFLYNSSAVADLLLDDITRIAINCFGTGGAIWQTSNDFKADEIAQNNGLVLSRYREKLESKGILVVRDLDRVPPTAAKIFFTICDSNEPLVHRAIIFFTIDISRQPERVVRSERSSTSIAEGILKDLWRDDLRPNALDPLVVRLTENVFRID